MQTTDLFGTGTPPTTAPALASDVLARLARLQGRPTRSEIAIVRPDGERCLLAFTARHSRQGIVEAARDRWEAVWQFCGLPQDGAIKLSKGRLETSNGCRIEFTGRTQRDAIMAGERLAYVKDAVGIAY